MHGPDDADRPEAPDHPDAPADEAEADPRDVIIAKLRARVASLEQQLEATKGQRDELLDLLQAMNEDPRQIRGLLKERIEQTPPAEPSEDSTAP